jgi:hypothetical protein
MTETNSSEPMTAVLLQLADLGQKLAAIEERQGAGTRQIADRITALAKIVTDLKGTVAGHAEAVVALDSLDRRVTALAEAFAEPTPRTVGDPAAYQPSSAPRWWKPDDPGRDDAVARLRSWVEQVYRPGYGHLAASLGECWELHPLCLFVLDWLSELWSVLYLSSDRTAGTLAGQAEWNTRLLAAAAEQLARETRGCRHGTAPHRTHGTGARS